MSTEWWEEPELTQVTLEQMNKLCDRMVELRAKKEALDAELSGVNDILKRAEQQFIQFLKEAGLKNYKNENGNFSITKRVSVNQPIDRDAFINYLKEKGDFENMITFNANKLKSYVVAEIEEKAREGDSQWLPPGISAPNEFETISFRKN